MLSRTTHQVGKHLEDPTKTMICSSSSCNNAWIEVGMLRGKFEKWCCNLTTSRFGRASSTFTSHKNDAGDINVSHYKPTLTFTDFWTIVWRAQRQSKNVLLIILLLTSNVQVTKAEDGVVGEDAAENQEDDSTEDALTTIIAYSSIGLLLSTITAIMGVVSFKEDKLIQRYRREGQIITAELKGMCYARGNENNKEFTASADYLRDLTKHYRIRIRKQIKVKGESIQKSDNTILMYVIPTLPKSGQVKDTVDRNAAWSYRASTAGLLCFTMIIAMICFFEPAIKAMRSGELEEEQRKLIQIVVGCAVGVGMGIWPFAYYMTGAFFDGLLREEYFETGDMLSADNDDSTISTNGSDPHLICRQEMRRDRSSSIESCPSKV